MRKREVMTVASFRMVNLVASVATVAIVAIVTIVTIVLISPRLASAQSNEGGMRADLQNEKVIRELYANFVEAWNRHDWNALAQMWTLDGDQQDPDGRVSHGRDGITVLLKAQHQTVFRETKLTLTIDGVWFIKGDVALVTGDYSLQGALMPDGRKLAPRGGFITAVLLQEQGKWLIAASRLMIPTQVPYRAEP